MEVIVAGFKPYDGRYPMIPFNRYEQGQIRRLAGWMPLQYEEALDGGDAELIACMAVLAMRRAGRIDREDVPGTYEKLLDADAAEITLDGQMEDRGETDPNPSGSSLSSDTSGPGSSKNSETSQQTPKANGDQHLDTSASDFPTLVR